MVFKGQYILDFGVFNTVLFILFNSFYMFERLLLIVFHGLALVLGSFHYFRSTPQVNNLILGPYTMLFVSAERL